MDRPLTARRYKSLLHQMTETTPTCLWNDSAAIDELAASIEDGAVGATCNPVIVLDVLGKEMHLWQDRIGELIADMPLASEDEIGWRLVEEISVRGAALLEPAFRRHQGTNGRLSIQTDPRLYRSTAAIVDQALRFHRLAANMIVKIPVTMAGVAAIEEATWRGVSINATVCFTLSQCLAVAEAVERGLARREAEGRDATSMGPVCTIMVGRLDDWLKVVADRHDLHVDPDLLKWAGVAVFKKAYRIFEERGYRLRLLSAAFRNDLHWSELIGGNVVISPPYAWQQRFNDSGLAIENRIDRPVDPRIVDELLRAFVDFRLAYEENALAPDEFDHFPPTVRTLRQFIGGTQTLSALIRDVMLPDPDLSGP